MPFGMTGFHRPFRQRNGFYIMASEDTRLSEAAPSSVRTRRILAETEGASVS